LPSFEENKLTGTKNIQKRVVIATLFFVAFTIFLGNETTGSLSLTPDITSRVTIFVTPSSIVIDGNLSAGEWSDATHVTKWYMDADPENADGYNYMYLAEDLDNLYIALDLSSDQTNNESGEWVGVWLNTNETVVEDADSDIRVDQWEAALNNGLESLFYNVENDTVFPFIDPSGSSSGPTHNFKSLNEQQKQVISLQSFPR